MDSSINDFWDVLLWSFWFFIWIAALMVWFRCLFDLFGDHTLSGWGKAGWALLLVFVPWLGALIYLIARGRSMTERQMAALKQQKAGSGRVHPAGRRNLGTSRPDRQRQGAARLRGHRPVGVQCAQGQGPGMTCPRPAASTSGCRVAVTALPCRHGRTGRAVPRCAAGCSAGRDGPSPR